MISTGRRARPAERQVALPAGLHLQVNAPESSRRLVCWLRDCHPALVMSLGPTWAEATGQDTVEDWVDARLRSRWGAEGADFDQEGLCFELREALNDGLPDGWTLDENQFVGPDLMPEDALDIVRDTIDRIDFWGIAQSYDNGD